MKTQDLSLPQLEALGAQLARALKATKPNTTEVLGGTMTARAHHQWAADVLGTKDALVKANPGFMEHRFMDACTLEGALRG